MIYSILTSCRRRGLNPQDYLTDVLARLPSAKITQIRSLRLLIPREALPDLT